MNEDEVYDALISMVVGETKQLSNDGIDDHLFCRHPSLPLADYLVEHCNYHRPHRFGHLAPRPVEARKADVLLRTFRDAVSRIHQVAHENGADPAAFAVEQHIVRVFDRATSRPSTPCVFTRHTLLVTRVA